MMHSIILLFICAFVSQGKLESDYPSTEFFFEAFLEKYHKTYTEPEYSHRLSIFKSNLAHLTELNSQESARSYSAGITKFSDLTQEEYEQIFLNAEKPKKRMQKNSIRLNQIPNQPIPDGSFDLRTQNLVTPVKNQGACACSWAFAATGLIETAYAQNTGELLSFSEQQLLDCLFLHSSICQFIQIDKVFSALYQVHLTTEQDYPYTGRQSLCDTSKIQPPTASAPFYYTYYNYDIEIYGMLKIGYSTAVMLDASQWNTYTGGIFSSPCSTLNYNYDAVVVGYFKNSTVAYWIVKTSLGQDFGENGYIRIALEDGNGNGSCCLQSFALWAFVNNN